jgi:hypothetical protein
VKFRKKPVVIEAVQLRLGQLERDVCAHRCRVDSGYKIQLVLNHARILFEETLPRDKLPLDPTPHLADRVERIVAMYLPQIDPEPPR